jgi:hypothetical protein
MLNFPLHKRLETLFGRVRVSSAGQQFDADTMMVAGKRRLNFRSKGEYYQVCCPFCTDSRFRLYISYMFGQNGSDGKPMRFLAHCFNENCLSNPQYYAEFVDKLESPLLIPLSEVQVKPGRRIAESDTIAVWPGECVPLLTLPQEHAAIQYVQARGYDPARLQRVYDVRYCLTSRYSLARDRLVIPVYQNKVLKGWQARYVGELDWKTQKNLPPKYFTMPGMSKSTVVYNLDRSRLFDACVITEGVVDVWGFGDGAVCTFGHSISDRQLELITAAFRRPARPIVLLFDPEAYAEKHVQNLLHNPRLLAHSGGFVHVKLPEGTDPGSTNRKVLRKYVKEQAALQGVTVTFNRRICDAEHS